MSSISWCDSYLLQNGKYDCFKLWNMRDQGKEQYIQEEKAPNSAEQDMLSNKEQNLRNGTHKCFKLCSVLCLDMF